MSATRHVLPTGHYAILFHSHNSLGGTHSNSLHLSDKEKEAQGAMITQTEAAQLGGLRL